MPRREKSIGANASRLERHEGSEVFAGDSANKPEEKEEQRFRDHRDAALAVLNSECRISRKEGGFLGQIAVDGSALSPKQANWLDALLARSGLPPFREDSHP